MLDDGVDLVDPGLSQQEAANLRSNILKDLPESFKDEVEVLRQAEAFEAMVGHRPIIGLLV